MTIEQAETITAARDHFSHDLHTTSSWYGRELLQVIDDLQKELRDQRGQLAELRTSDMETARVKHLLKEGFVLVEQGAPPPWMESLNYETRQSALNNRASFPNIYVLKENS